MPTIGDFKIGDKVRVYVISATDHRLADTPSTITEHMAEATIVCNCGTYWLSGYEAVILGRNDKPFDCACHDANMCRYACNASQQYKYHIAAFLRRLAFPAILIPGQKCMACGITCPHAIPNIGDKYLCVGCKSLSIFEE
jgi:hypothetical protein